MILLLVLPRASIVCRTPPTTTSTKKFGLSNNLKRMYFPASLFWIAVAVLVVDVLVAVTYVVWMLVQKYNRRKEKKKAQEESNQLIINQNPFHKTPVTEIEYSPDVFEIPGHTLSVNGNARNLKLSTISSNQRWQNKEVVGSIDVNKYQDPSIKRKLRSIPRLCFELFYNFRTSQIEVTLKRGKYLPEYANVDIIVSILLSTSFTIYHTSRFNGPHPIFNEVVRFPMESKDISADPPVKIKFNVWTIDEQSRKDPFGFVEVNVEEIFTRYGVTPPAGEGIVWRNIMETNTLSDGTDIGDVLISLSYLPGANRISVVLVQAKDLTISTSDKDIHGVISMLYREQLLKVFFSSYVDIASNPKFNEEFTFDLGHFKSVNIDGIAIQVSLQARPMKRFAKPRPIGKVLIGNSGSGNRLGREHWVNMLTTHVSVSKWHTLEPYDIEHS